jgi:superfamily II DNA/RNA helicase
MSSDDIFVDTCVSTLTLLTSLPSQPFSFFSVLLVCCVFAHSIINHQSDVRDCCIVAPSACKEYVYITQKASEEKKSAEVGPRRKMSRAGNNNNNTLRKQRGSSCAQNQRMMARPKGIHFALSLGVLCTSTCSSNNNGASAFHVGVPRRSILNKQQLQSRPFLPSSRTGSQCLYAEEKSRSVSVSAGGNKQKKRQQKGGKRRFAQTIHLDESVVSSESSQLSGSVTGKPRVSTSTPDDVKKTISNNYSQGAVASYQAPKSEGNKPNAPRRRRTAPLPKSMMVSKSLSIDDLEAKLSQRWDSDSISNPQSQTQPKVSASTTNTKASKSQSTKRVSAFKSTPVFDPWMEMEELENERSASNFSRGGNNDNDVKKSKSSENIVEISFGEDEFYDDDDLEYIEEEGEKDDDDTFDVNDDGLDEQAAARPAPSTSPTDNNSYPSPSSGSGGGGGFFFRNDEPVQDSPKMNNREREGRFPERANEKKGLASKQGVTTSAEETDTAVRQNLQQKKREREATSKALPLLDEQGKEQYLTLDMAMKPLNLLAALKRDSDEDNDEDDEDEEDIETFEDLGITSNSLLRNLEEMGCATPLPVQSQSCEAALDEKDILISTHTGSGKTLAFLVPLIQRLLEDLEVEAKMPSGIEIVGDEDDQEKDSKTVPIKSPNVRVIIVAPGRELAAQIVAVARELLSNTGVGVQMAIGGTPFTRCLDMIRKKKPALLVGTPGRIAELVVGREQERSGKVKVNSLQALVMDEFDALLEYSIHREPTIAIWDAVQRQHSNRRMQAILCSATAADIKPEKLKHFLHDDHVHVSSGETSGMVTQGNKIRTSLTTLHGAVHLEHRRYALETVRRILHTSPSPEQVLIFVNNARRVGIVVDKLADMGIIAAPLHGGAGSDKSDRAEVSKALREGYVGVVVATEMAARGLDAPYLTHVINLDLPTDASHYAHRSGRCGRGGRPGVVINVTCDPKERRVPHRFADTLGVTMHVADPRQGKIIVIDDSVVIDGNGF